MHNVRLLIIGLLAGLILFGCGSVPSQGQYQVEIRRTSYGIPHITAGDYGSLGYGEGYASAEDHICIIADEIVSTRSEKSKYHGFGENNVFLFQDITLKGLGIQNQAAQRFRDQPKVVQEWIIGYTAGFNTYLKEKGPENVGSWCEGTEWLVEVSPVDMFARFLTLPQSGPRLANLIATAAPPGQATATSFSRADENLATLKNLSESVYGSNGWAIGKDRSANGRGMLMGNPHYPWVGVNRFWEKHLTIPGKMDVYGVHLVGIPGVAIGFNQHVGWTHTVSASKRLTFYKLDLVSGDPTSYRYDGEQRKMTSKIIQIAVRNADGTLSQQNHTVWFSHYGPIVNMPGMPWDDKMAFTYRDANANNDGSMAQWLDMGLAKDLDRLKKAHKKWNAMPWVNTMATSADGRAWYIDGSSVPNLNQEALDLWRQRLETDSLTKQLFEKMNLVLLDGSDSRFEWQSHDESRFPGVNPYMAKPKQERPDYIFNSNNSHWLTNTSAPLSGYSPLNGAEKTARSLRTRMNARLLADERPTGPSGTDGKFTQMELQDALFSNRNMAAELLLEPLVALCENVETVSVNGKDVQVKPACEILSNYDKRLNLDSRGAVLFREWITAYNSDALHQAGHLFSAPFDETDPVNTPRGLADGDLALKNLARAVLIMEKANLPLDVTLGEVQFAYRGEQKIPVHGGFGQHEGVANFIGYTRYKSIVPYKKPQKYIEGSNYLTDIGYPVNYGSSFILSLAYTDGGPRANALLTYGQSGDPSSPHYADQTRLFSQKDWRPILFNEADILTDTKSVKTLTAPRN